MLRYFMYALPFNLTGGYTAGQIAGWLYQQMGTNALMGATPARYVSELQNYIARLKSENPSAWANIQISAGTYSAMNYANLSSAINNGRICFMIIWHGTSAHYINPVGYYLYSNADVYVRVITNWDRNANRYYKFMTAGTVNSAIGTLGYVQITD